VSYLLDTNVISELRKGDRANAGVVTWFADVTEDEIYLSVLTAGELRRGVDSIQRRDRESAAALNRWLRGLVEAFGDRLLAIDHAVAEEWGRMNVARSLPAIDSLLAATAKVHGLTFVTRNTKDVARTGVHCINPFVSQ
jgi:predicted nucleic acid-binding protein